MFKPSDIQLILLSTAAQRNEGSLLPPSETLGDQASRIRRSITALIKRGFAAEGPGSVAISWRADGDTHFGVFITDAGRTAIGCEPPEAAPRSTPPEPTPAPKRQTKADLVIGLLQRAGGATIDELTTTTGWLPHTTRAALTGLRKKGHQIDRGKRAEATCYSIAAAA